MGSEEGGSNVDRKETDVVPEEREQTTNTGAVGEAANVLKALAHVFTNI